MVSVTQNSHHHKPLMVQAPVRALDPDGLAVVSAGTIAFAVGVAVCWWYAGSLAATGRLWYLGVAATGTVLGLIGVGFGLIRRARRQRATAQPARRSVEEPLVDTDRVPDRD